MGGAGVVGVLGPAESAPRWCGGVAGAGRRSTAVNPCSRWRLRAVTGPSCRGNRAAAAGSTKQSKPNSRNNPRQPRAEAPAPAPAPATTTSTGDHERRQLPAAAAATCSSHQSSSNDQQLVVACGLLLLKAVAAVRYCWWLLLVLGAEVRSAGHCWLPPHIR